MKGLGGKWGLVAIVVLFVGGFLVLPDDARIKQVSTWQKLANPGRLSSVHANLEQDCAACHTAVQGAVAVNCILCHASNEDLLMRQPTAFHSSIASCKECHPEHRGLGERPTLMDHEALSKIGLEALGEEADEERSVLRAYLRSWIEADAPLHPTQRVSRLEAALACDECHGNEDQHFGLMGADCGQCHSTSMWTLPEFRHPSPKSRDCAQCHQAPPSHYMGHFKMVSAKVARKPHAKVEQCFECHRTTAWTDIPGVGHYKHH